MNKILVINASVISPDKSYSNAIADKFIEEYKLINPNDEIVRKINLSEEKIASITLTDKNFSNFFNADDCDKYIDELKSVDKLIINTSMTNFNIPSVLKNYLDHILVADKTFSYKYSKKGEAIGLLTNLKVQLIITQGAPTGWYLWGNLADYLKGTFEFAGTKVAKPLTIAGTKVAPYKDMTPIDVVNDNIDLIKELAKEF